MTNMLGSAAVEPLIEGVPPELLGIGAGWALFAILAIFVTRQIIRGNLVPRSTHDDVIHDRDEWRSESRLKDAQLAEKDVQLGHLAEVGETVKQLARGLQKEITP